LSTRHIDAESFLKVDESFILKMTARAEQPSGQAKTVLAAETAIRNFLAFKDDLESELYSDVLHDT
jgi:hypothetical protein